MSSERIIPTTDVEDCYKVIRTRCKKIRQSSDNNDRELRSSSSVRKYVQHLRWFDSWLKENDLEPKEVSLMDAEEVAIRLSEDFNGSTGLYKWYEIRKLYDFLERKQEIDENPFDTYDASELRSEFGLSRTSEQDKQLGENEKYAVSQEEVRMMEEQRPKIRDQLIIRMLWQTGLRRKELSHLTLDDVDPDAREVTVRGSNAKNYQRRVVPYQPTLDGLLTQWVEHGYRDACLAGDESQDWLFVGERGGRLSGRRISEIVREAAEDCGLQRELFEDGRGGSRRKITAHNIRHGYGSYMVNETEASLFEVSKLMGHRSVEVTQQRYVAHDVRAGTETGHRYGPE